jgi:hypothetical protein
MSHARGERSETGANYQIQEVESKQERIVPRGVGCSVHSPREKAAARTAPGARLDSLSVYDDSVCLP